MSNPFDKKLYPNCHAGHEYAEKVVSGEIVAGIYIIGACERYLREVEKENDDYYFDADKAEKFLRIVQQFEHVIGEWATAKIIFEPWQKWIWMNIMGFISKITGYRRFRTAHIEVARGNAKSTMASQSALYFLNFDSSQGNQIATVATKKEQARIVLDAARAMAKKNKSYLKATGTRVLAHSIAHDKSNSVVRALSAEASGLDGLNDVLAVLDELHAMKQDTFDVIVSGMGKRKDSLTLCITTAGFNTDSVGYFQSIYAKKVALGEIEDESTNQFFAAVYTLDPADDIFDSKNWIKANPNIGVSVDLDKLTADIAKAKESPTDIANIKVKRLNLWLSEATPFFDLQAWDACYDPTLNIKDFKNKKCKKALDLAYVEDLTTIGDLFREKEIYSFFEKTYLPEEAIKRAKNPLYTESVAKGFLIATPGEVINYANIEKILQEDAKQNRISECMYDPWSATEVAQNLSGKIEMVKFPMTVANLSEPMKKLDALIREKKFRHNGSPLLRWCISNVVAKVDANGNVFPRKSHPRMKIDPVITIIMALAAWLLDEKDESVYETRGVRRI